MLIKVFCSGPVETNCILVACPQTKEAAIIDVPLESVSWILEELEKNALHLKMILLTHSHWDHIGGLSELKKKLSTPVYVHIEDRANVEHPGTDGLPLLFPIQGVIPEHSLEGDQVLNLGNIKIDVLHTPGHTPGGVCFWFPQEKVLVSGDTLFKGAIGNLSFKTARPRLMSSSLQKLWDLPLDTKVIPGHGEQTTIQAEQKQMRRFM